jgi:hypothetical protein
LLKKRKQSKIKNMLDRACQVVEKVQQGYRQQNADLQRLGVLNTKTAGFHHAKGVTGLIFIAGSTAAMILMW